MNKILDFIKKNYILLGVIVALSIIIAIFATVSKTEIVQQQDTGVFWHLKYDSIQTVDLNENI